MSKVDGKESALENYRALLKKIDAKFEQIELKNKDAMRCGAGCHSCCLPDLSVCAVEKESIARYLQSSEKQAALPSSDSWAGKRCAFLDSSGHCSIYPVRPVVCRSHGAPIKFKDDATREVLVDVCNLNFTEGSLNELPDSEFINIDTLNSILAVINRQFGDDGALRYSLAQLARESPQKE